MSYHIFYSGQNVCYIIGGGLKSVNFKEGGDHLIMIYISGLRGNDQGYEVQKGMTLLKQFINHDSNMAKNIHTWLLLCLYCSKLS